MLDTTIGIIRSALKGDPSITPRDRARILASLRNGLEDETAVANAAIRSTAPRIVRRGDAAKMYGCSLRLIDRLAAQGILRKIRLPGRKRGAGFIERELLAVIEGK